jgi:DNA-binding PadR family transcriptional regulator
VARRKVSNLLGLTLLALLDPGLPMHPYQLAAVLRRTGKDQNFTIKWGSLYTVVQNLERHGLIEAAGNSRQGRRPERTAYTVTDAGRAELRQWLSELVADPVPEQSPFRAALAVLSVLPPDQAADLLRHRLAALEAQVGVQRAELADSMRYERIFLIEGEYALAMRQAEADWVRRLLGDLEDGSFTGLATWQAYHDSGQVSPAWTELLAEGS